MWSLRAVQGIIPLIFEFIPKISLYKRLSKDIRHEGRHINEGYTTRSFLYIYIKIQINESVRVLIENVQNVDRHIKLRTCRTLFCISIEYIQHVYQGWCPNENKWLINWTYATLRYTYSWRIYIKWVEISIKGVVNQLNYLLDIQHIWNEYVYRRLYNTWFDVLSNLNKSLRMNFGVSHKGSHK